MTAEQNTDRPCWFVGASFGRRGDQTDRFIEQGIWEHGFDDDDHLPEVQSIQPGDRIAIKSTYAKKGNLPFYNREKHVSVMDIKAIGTVLENLGDGRSVRVDWQRFDFPRRWYFSTIWPTLRKVSPGDNPKSDALIAFAFEGKRQDLDWFRGKEGSVSIDEDSSWIPFYEEVADKILGYKNKRGELIAGIHALSENLKIPPALQDQFPDGTTGPLKDICPFTVMGLLNMSMKPENRQERADGLASFLEVAETPKIAPIVPMLSPQRAWFFTYDNKRRDEDIDILWELFDKAIDFAALDNADTRKEFVTAYDEAMQCSGVKWNITMGLYWIRPWSFVTLDATSRFYVGNVLETKSSSTPYSGEEYLGILDSLKKRFEDTTFIANSFPELSRAGWKYELERREYSDDNKESDHSENEGDRSWVPFYEEVADKLLEYKDRRDELMAGIHAFSENLAKPLALEDRFLDGTTGPARDICPFSVMELFNQGLTDANRQARAEELARFLDVQEPPKIYSFAPTSYSGSTWFFVHSKERDPQSIDLLWDLFDKAMTFAASDDEDTRAAFVQAYANARSCAVQWSTSVGLFWMRPQRFLPLDKKSRSYVKNVLDIEIPKDPHAGGDYLDTVDNLKNRFEDANFAVNSFPELFMKAWKPELSPTLDDAPSPYTVGDILADGCFMERERLEQILNRWKDKHNLILQGPPGTGKTWLAKRLAYALIGEAGSDRVRAVQFHPNLSYEDFVRGWRPDGEGHLSLMDGPFIEMVNRAKSDPDRKYVVVIEEVNRGEPAKIFGELLTLLESDKRNPQEALTLTYRHSDEGEYIPDNLYVIGTMNIADRSLALVDLALRRRFAFVDLEPTFGSKWRKFVQDKYGESEDHDIDDDTINEIELRMNELNNDIEKDKSLGKQFRVGHSYVTPTNTPTSGGREWFRAVVDTDIGPLLEEYWFDNLEEAKNAREKLLRDF